MIIHLIGSMRHFDDDLPIMRKIADIITNNSSNLILNWFEGVSDRKSRGTTNELSLNWQEIVDANLRSVTQADALIIEGSRFNYSQGFQTAVALQNNKPVLNLYREELPEYKEWPDKLFVSGISHPLFISVPYKTQEDLEKTVTKFIKDHSQKTQDLDVTLALTTADFKKLEKLSRSEGKSKTSIIKDIVTEKLNDK